MNKLNLYYQRNIEILENKGYTQLDRSGGHWVDCLRSNMTGVYFLGQYMLEDKTNRKIFLYIKVGYSSNIIKRMIGIETGNPNNLELLYIYRTTELKKVEGEIKYKLRDYHFRKEWYFWNTEVKNLVYHLAKSRNEEEDLIYNLTYRNPTDLQSVNEGNF